MFSRSKFPKIAGKGPVYICNQEHSFVLKMLSDLQPMQCEHAFNSSGLQIRGGNGCFSIDFFEFSIEN